MSVTPGKVTVDEDTTGVTVRFAGDLDLAGARKLMDRVIPVLDGDRVRDLTLDLVGVEFCDSSGLSALVDLRKRCSAQGWHLRTVNLQPAVRRIVDRKSVV